MNFRYLNPMTAAFLESEVNYDYATILVENTPFMTVNTDRSIAIPLQEKLVTNYLAELNNTRRLIDFGIISLNRPYHVLNGSSGMEENLQTTTGILLKILPRYQVFMSMTPKYIG